MTSSAQRSASATGPMPDVAARGSSAAWRTSSGVAPASSARPQCVLKAPSMRAVAKAPRLISSRYLASRGPASSMARRKAVKASAALDDTSRTRSTGPRARVVWAMTSSSSTWCPARRMRAGLTSHYSTDMASDRLAGSALPRRRDESAVELDHGAAGRELGNGLVRQHLGRRRAECAQHRDPVANLRRARPALVDLRVRVAAQRLTAPVRYQLEDLAVPLDVDGAVLGVAGPVRKPAARDDDGALVAALDRLADGPAKGVAPVGARHGRLEAVLNDGHDGDVHPGREEVERHHAAVVERKPLGPSGLDAGVDRVLHDGAGERRRAGDLHAIDAQPLLQRTLESLG